MSLLTGKNNSESKFKKVELLVVDDDSADVALLINALEESKILDKIAVARNGQELIDFLNKRKIAKDDQPDLILLDLNMPRKSGRQALSEIKQDPEFRKIPVIIFTSSDDEKDVAECYYLHANCYIKKPMELEKMRDVMTKIEDFWFKTATLVS